MDVKSQWLAELKEFILESEKRICEKFEKRFQATDARVSTLQAPPATRFSLSRQSTSACDMECRMPMHLVTDDSRYSAWSSPAVAEAAFAETPTNISPQAEWGRCIEKVASGPATVQEPTRSATPDKVPGESTWKPTFFNKWASAPAAFGQMFEPQTVGACEDCLRPDCVAWVEGQPLPVAVSKIKAGQRVLCHDNLARGMKYAEVAEVLIQAGSAEWVTVVLEDGTHLEMTANHPTQPLANDGERSTVRSGDLRAGLDYLMVLRTMPVLVKEVIHQGCEDTDDDEVCIKDRCFLTLKQPERHAIFVAPPPDTMSGMPGVNTMAVGSADAKPVEQQLRLNVRNTFYDADDPDMDREAGLPRSTSLPHDFNFDFKLEPPVKVPLWRQSRELLRSSRSSRQSSREYSNISMSSYQSSAYSAYSGGDSGEHRTVIVAPKMQPKFQMAGGGSVIGTLNTRSGQGMMALSEIGYIKKLGLRSLGGACHAGGTCTPCLFANRQQHDGGGPCWKGMFCERCHEDHGRLADKKPKSGRMRQKMAKNKPLP